MRGINIKNNLLGKYEMVSLSGKIFIIGMLGLLVSIFGVIGFTLNDVGYSLEQIITGLVVVVGVLGSAFAWALIRKPKRYNKRRAFSPETKQKVLRRQNYKCNVCGVSPKNWDFDHIGDRSDNSPGNCQALCLDCHRDKTRREARQKK